MFAGFDPCASNSIGTGSQLTCSMWSDTRITCSVPPGTARFGYLRVQIEARSAVSRAVKYATPVVVSVLPQLTNTAGGEVISISTCMRTCAYVCACACECVCCVRCVCVCGVYMCMCMCAFMCLFCCFAFIAPILEAAYMHVLEALSLPPRPCYC